ncbi:protease complex subunit PrcB family protein [Flavobacterium psychroterrae]|uniref:Protease complex subunit PrcB family protein n=1 Tax=Flavobacterium psychroterrae TaxID=2133767 RepID=A0ABS5PD75_9FLAO|nr:protease complex subunit PrcB family protein [Flavobacterium psychroterrae]MBS7232237.1 protease complex subunit PrcB family protein [Flavobacterium psychroterrae]
MKKLMLSLFIAFGFSACSLNNDDLNVDCGASEDKVFTGFPLLCSYSVKTLPNNPTPVLVGSDETMKALFTKNENSCPNSTDTPIDFTKEILVGLFAGLKPTNGYSIKITSIVENKCEILINYYEKAPQAGETLTQGPSYPSDFILIPRTGKQILFNKTTETTDNIVVGTFSKQCTGADCQKFYQINDFSILKFLNVVAGGYDFSPYRYTSTTKKGDYTLFLKNVPTEILNLKGQTKTYGTPDAADHGGVYFELRQGAVTTKVFIDNTDTSDQSAEVKVFKKAIQDKITALK